MALGMKKAYGIWDKTPVFYGIKLNFWLAVINIQVTIY
jgi:hypothetical protein